MEKITDLDDLLRHSWNLLFRGAVQRRHAYHTPVLATMNASTPHARTVVLRETDTKKRRLIIYTDLRTQKVADIQVNPQASLVFWDKGKNTQIRASGTVHLHQKDEVAKKYWDKIPAKNRRDYATKQAPGSEKEGDYLPAYWQEEELDASKTEVHFEHFAVLIVEVNQLDFLLLKREGHSRAKFEWKEEQWKGSWVVP
ncbi:MAG: pyridoxamine 5'-phosphate oxidase family protein [Bacteroidota bacterium]